MKYIVCLAIMSLVVGCGDNTEINVVSPEVSFDSNSEILPPTDEWPFEGKYVHDKEPVEIDFDKDILTLYGHTKNSSFNRGPVIDNVYYIDIGMEKTDMEIRSIPPNMIELDQGHDGADVLKEHYGSRTIILYKE